MFFRVLLVAGTITVVEVFHAYDERRLDLFHVSGSYSGMVFGEVRHRSSGPPVQSSLSVRRAAVSVAMRGIDVL